MRNLKRFLTAAFSFALMVSLWLSGATLVKSAKAENDTKIYDITEVYSDIVVGADFSMVYGTVYTGSEVNIGDTIKFVYKMNAQKNPEHYARSAFGIGAYGIYFYCSSDTVSIRPVNLSGGTFSRGNEFATINRIPFGTYNELTLKVEKAENSHIMLVMTYHEDGEIKSVSLDYGTTTTPDMKFRFGDNNINGNIVKSTIVPPVFGDGSFNYSAYIEGVNVYGGCNLSVIANEKAVAEGVPEGFTGNVLKMSNTAGSPYQMDMALDFSALNYKRKFITGLSFRIYIAGTSSDNNKHPEFRIPYPGKADVWILGGGIGANKTDEWITISVSSDQLDKICIDGYLKTVAACLRTNAATTMYIDKIELTTIELEKEPPVISAPVTTFIVTEGAYPVPADKIATVTDNSGEYFVSYEWSEDALDELGRLKKGTHTCKLIATDKCDNTTTLDITYIVEPEPETTFYKITFKVENIDDIVVEYCEDEIEYFVPPTAPENSHFEFKWEAFTLEKTNNQIVNGVYIPKVYTVTYIVDGEIYETVTYTSENMTINEPDVPAKDGYEGKWEEYALDFADIAVHAIYTKSGSEPTESDSLAQSDENSGSASQKTSGGCFSGLYSGFAALGTLAISAFIIIKHKKED